MPNQPSSATGWCPFALQRPIVATNFSSGRRGHTVKAVVLHVVDGNMANVFDLFNRAGRLVSAHFCIGKDGTIEQYISIEDMAYGNGLAWIDNRWAKNRGTQDQPNWVTVKPTWQDITPPHNPNLYTISIEHDGKPEDVWTPQMYAANNRLLQWIAQQCHLTYVPHRTLIGHCEIDTLDKGNCPGPRVDYEKIAADGNAGSVSPEALNAILASARARTWLPINTSSALYKFASANQLGNPQTDEFDFQIGNEVYTCQVFNLGIACAKKGDWEHLQSLKKTNESLLNDVATATLAAAQKQTWMPINIDSGFYKFAQANNLGDPQTDEFDFTVGDAYRGQVYNMGFVYAKKTDLSNMQWMAKSMSL